jgi:hypothetical protein
MNKYPIYIVSKGRADSRLTAKALEKMGVDYHIIVEAAEYDQYCSVIAKDKVLVLPEKYLDDYDTFDDLGRTKSTGPGAARNFAWQHSIDNGFAWHWVMDDNLKSFSRLNNNLKIRANTGAIFQAMEDFCDRYTNVAIAGPNYDFFAKRKQLIPPYITNTRIYSCLLIRNDIPFRWRGRYNEDTDLSLRVLKDGWCTIQFNAFLQGKVRTQVLKGGNTAEFYAKEGTKPKSDMQLRMHPDVSSTVWKFGRYHHHVDYRPFRTNRLKRKPDIDVPKVVNDYGMTLKRVK